MDPFNYSSDDDVHTSDDDLRISTTDVMLDLIFNYPMWESNRQHQRHTRIYIDRNREEGHSQLFNDYFSTNPVYTDDQFRRRFRMRRPLFLRIVEALCNHDDHFQMKRDATGRLGLSPLQKCTACIRMLAYGSSADYVDEYVRIGASTAIEYLKRFVNGICEIFGEQYMRRPDNVDIQRLLQMGAARGFPGMLGSLDCMHWEWKNCPVAWQGQYKRGDHSKPTIILEAVASQDLWIWHAFFGMAGSNNDINVLNQSDLFNAELQGTAPEVHFNVNGTQYDKGYYLADGIYPSWTTIVKTIPMPQSNKRKFFAKRQEEARKDVERAFGVLQSRFAIVRGPVRQWHMDIIKSIMRACVIMHNMIVEDERHTYVNYDYETSPDEIPQPEINYAPHRSFQRYMQRRFQVRNRETHHQLQADLVEHIWNNFRDEDNED